jgi:hypothetical protein
MGGKRSHAWLDTKFKITKWHGIKRNLFKVDEFLQIERKCEKNKLSISL